MYGKANRTKSTNSLLESSMRTALVRGPNCSAFFGVKDLITVTQNFQKKGHREGHPTSPRTASTTRAVCPAWLGAGGQLVFHGDQRRGREGPLVGRGWSELHEGRHRAANGSRLSCTSPRRRAVQHRFVAAEEGLWVGVLTFDPVHLVAQRTSPPAGRSQGPPGTTLLGCSSGGNELH